MDVTRETVERERRRWLDDAPAVVELINAVRDDLGDAFGVEVGDVDQEAYRAEVRTVFGDGDVALNAAALAGLLRELDVEADYPGFVVDELLGRRLAAMIAGSQPLELLAEATFHYADVRHHPDGTAGEDDLQAALAAGFQTRLPGWGWTDRESPYGIDPDADR